jgi:hypothetical protein
MPAMPPFHALPAFATCRRDDAADATLIFDADII